MSMNLKGKICLAIVQYGYIQQLFNHHQQNFFISRLLLYIKLSVTTKRNILNATLSKERLMEEANPFLNFLVP
ncbi:hypothetical protein F990_01652 [Acinetobacter tjernbergiae DSM 14971 = CIP 107465]|uniref:Uncharacterized protein n=1 Tax=Acinetobacter tjernbergiae DSM 14971 = CIP 107465 TaxID=1120928 RepID=V2UM44_9GAMM|nr:hypothetical protein F990_01652 [Acinetobacter tjernbergiae DSM 14971 = CIP 107465]